MDHAILEHKLIVPAHLVPLNALEAFKVTLKNADDEQVDYAFYDIDYANNLYYFDRGDLGLVQQIFGHLKIEDRRSRPRMSSSSVVTESGIGLTFTGSMRDNQKHVADFLTDGFGYGQLKAHPRFGKTVVMTNVTCRLGLKTLFLSHQIDLANQAYERFIQFTNVMDIEYEMGRKVVGVVEDWDDLLELDVAIMPYQKFVSGKNADKWIQKLKNQFGLIFIDECFEYTTVVTLADGSQEYIGKIVGRLSKGDSVHVKSYNPIANVWENQKVTGCSRKRATTEWIRVGLGGSCGILCSPNHGWYLEGYRKTKAEDLKIGDRVMVMPNTMGRASLYSSEIVTSLSRKPVKSKRPMMYNLEVDNNHNYLVGKARFLVSNCHRIKAERYSQVIGSFNSAYRYGVSGTTELKNEVHLLNNNIIGPVVVEGHGDQLPCTVITYNTNVNVPLRPSKMFFTMMQNYFSSHEARNQLMLAVVHEYLKAGHTIIAVTDRTGHCDWFTQEIKKLGFTAESYHAKRFNTKDQREEMLNRVRSGKTQAMIAMRSMVLGLDIPRATAFFNLFPTANGPNYFQEFSRVRTPWTCEVTGYVKEQGYVIDFRDNHHILKACYKTRRKEYVKNNFKIFDDLSDEERR